jgi:hypothetical protein
MNIGDRVRFLHGKEEGIVRKIIDARTIEVEIEDGFRIPVQLRELVVIAREEKHLFDEKEDKRVNNSDILSTEGLYLAFTGESRFNFYFVNNTDFQVLFSIGTEVSGTHKGLASKILESKQAFMIKPMDIKDFENWGTFVIQVIYHLNGGYPFKEGMIRRIKIKSSQFYSSKAKAPIINEDAYLIQIDAENVNTQTLSNKLNETKTVRKDGFIGLKVEREVDLHIEKIAKDASKLSAYEILTIQLETFQKHFDNALAMGMNEIVFIHGNGNGTLKTEIHKRLSKSKDIKFFQDAQKDKFGYGATLVKFN